MKLPVLSIIIFFFIGYSLKGQTIISGVITDSLNNPIPSASVYLSKTTFGVLTDAKGVYSLTINQDGVYEMIASCIGYKSNSQFIAVNGKKQNINIKLSINLILLKEVSVTSKEKNRLANYTQFIKLFLGETINSKDCKIINPEDLHLFRDSKNKTLNGFSVKPLRIENRALGYFIIYDLSDFSYNLETGLLKFEGNHYFEPLTGSQREINKWTRNRLSAYYGSRMHFFRAFFSDSLSLENFKIFECKIDSANKEFTIIKPLLENDLSLTKTRNYKTMYSKSPLLISYTDNHPELATGLTGFQPRKVISTITFSDFINVYQNGYFDNPYSIVWGRDMGTERIADMLPYDFLPHTYRKVESADVLNNSSIEKYLLSQQKNIARDQVFVHTDRNMYTPGDTIHFQAYIRDRFTNVFESTSVSLYAMLFNDKQLMIDSSRFRIEKSISSGWLTVPSKAETGKYHFVAFTGMMQNFDPLDAFQTDISVKAKVYDQEKVEVEFNKKIYQKGDSIRAKIKISDTRGESLGSQKFQYILITRNYSLKALETHTNKKGESVITINIPDTIDSGLRLQVITKKNKNSISETKDFNIPFEDKYFELRFLPEGGTLVAGLEQRIGFNATDFRGEPISIVGLLKNKTGSIVDTIRSGDYGPGLFVCTPEPGMYVELINVAGKEKIWPLSDPVKTGTSMSVKPVDNRSFSIEIQSTNYSNEILIVSGTLNTTNIFSQELKLNKKQRIVVQTDQLMSGVAQITLFNKEMKPLAERLYYINADKHLKFNIKTEKDVYNPGQKTELAVSVTDGQGNPAEGIFSIAVADSSSGHNAELFTPGIEYIFNCYPFFPGTLPAKVLIKGLENLTNDDRDLLLMVYGWSKYNWDFNKENEPAKELVNYDLLKMKILYAAKSHRADRRLDLISLEGPSVKHLHTNNLGEISLPLDSLPEITRSVTMMPDVKNKKRVTGAMLSIPFNEKYFKSNKLYTPQQVIPSDIYNISPVYQNISLGDNVIEIPEVIIIGHPENKRVYHDKYEEMYQYADVRSLDYNLLWTSASLEDAVRRTVYPYSMTNNAVFLSPSHSFFGGGIPALIVEDGIPIYSDDGWNLAQAIQPSEITSLTILKGGEGVTLYGLAAAGGVIFINTRSADPNLMKIRTDWKLQHSKDKMLLPISLYRSDKEFYNPTKFEIENDPVIQSRSTIFWKHEVYFNGKEPVKIKYNNLKHNGPVIITINGASFNNLVGTGKAGYLVN